MRPALPASRKKRWIDLAQQERHSTRTRRSRLEVQLSVVGGFDDDNEIPQIWVQGTEGLVQERIQPTKVGKYSEKSALQLARRLPES